VFVNDVQVLLRCGSGAFRGCPRAGIEIQKDRGVRICNGRTARSTTGIRSSQRLDRTAESKISCWLEYKLVSQSITNNTARSLLYVHCYLWEHLAIRRVLQQRNGKFTRSQRVQRRKLDLKPSGRVLRFQDSVPRIMYAVFRRLRFFIRHKVPDDPFDNGASRSRHMAEVPLRTIRRDTRQITLDDIANLGISASIGTASAYGNHASDDPRGPRSYPP
jgi:hypothetical protein